MFSSDSANPMRTVRAQAIGALGHSGSSNAITWLKEIADADLLRMRHDALQALAQLGDDIHVPYFVSMMKNRSMAGAADAAHALATLGTLKARHTLLTIAQRENGGAVRLAAIRGLSVFNDPTVVHLLETLTSHEQVNVAKAAISSYAQLAPSGAVDRLSLIAQHGRRSLQGEATQGLAATGSMEARDELINILFAEDSQTSIFAAEALAEIGDDVAIQALVDGLEGGRDIIQSVLNAMAHAPTHEVLTTALSDFIHKSDGETSTKASQILAKHVGEKAIPHILKAIIKFGRNGQSGFCHILGSIDGERATQALLNFVGTGKASLQLDALTALVRHDRISSAVARELTIEQLRHTKDSRSTKRLIQILAKQNDAASDSHIMNLLETKPDRQIRSIVSAISKDGGSELVGEVLAHIRTLPAGPRRHTMIASLGLDRPENREFLLEAAAGTGDEAAEILSRYAWYAPNEVRDLAFDATQSDNLQLRVSAVRVLRGINGTKEINALADLTKDPEGFVKIRAMDALAYNEEPYAKEVLIDAFQTGDEAVRVASAYHIAQSGHPRSLNLLVEAALSDRKHGSVFYHAIENLNSPESKQALARIKKLAPADHRELQEDILHSALIAEEQESQAAFEAPEKQLEGLRADLLY